MRWLAGIAGLMMSSCAVVSPPPMLVHQDSVLRSGRGAVSIAAAAGGGLGGFVDPFVGGRGEAEVQVTPELALGLSGGGGRNVDGHGNLEWLGAGRLHASIRPAGVDWVTVRTGLGAGAGSTGLAYLTGDVGATFGWTFKDRVRPYGGLSLAFSAPVRQGSFLGTGDDAHPVHATLYVNPAAGVSVRLVDRLDLSLEVQGTFGHDFHSDSVFGGVGVLGLRYTFGGSPAK